MAIRDPDRRLMAFDLLRLLRDQKFALKLSCKTTNFTGKMSAMNPPPFPRVCAHRGLSGLCPENTLPAFAAAVALGADEIELDVWASRDGELVVCHDDDVARTSNGKGLVR